jgi:hypothetical protein
VNDPKPTLPASATLLNNARPKKGKIAARHLF